MKKSILVSFVAIFSVFILASCGTTKEVAFPGMYEEKPTVLLIMPPINNSNVVEAKDYFYTTLNVPMAEAGYYVLPPVATYSALKRESAYDSEMFLEADLSKFKQLFGADIAVFTIIKSWEKSILTASVTVNVEYIFRSTKTNNVIFHRDVTISYDNSTNISNSSVLDIIFDLTTNTIETATTDSVSVAITCNDIAFEDLPAGKYSAKYEKDGKESANSVIITKTVSKSK